MSGIRGRIEKGFETIAGVIYAHRIKTLLFMMVLVVALFSQLPKTQVDISTEGFMHDDDPTLLEYNRFREQFGRDEMILVGIHSQNIFSQGFLQKLKRFHDDLAENTPYLEDITSIINARSTRGEKNELIVEDLLEHWPENQKDLDILKARIFDNPIYPNILISIDGTYTTVMIELQAYSSIGVEEDVLGGFDDTSETRPPENRPFLTDAENSEAVNTVKKIVEKYRADDFNIYIAGSAAVIHFLKTSMMYDMRKFMALALVTVAVFLYLMFRRALGVLMPLLIVILSLISTISLMAAFGTAIKLPTQILPSFILAVSVGYSVHILAIFYHRLRKGEAKREAIIYAIGHSGLAIVMTAATTAGGLFSFSTSEVAPIADLGLFAGFGVLLAMVYTIVLLPALLALFPVKVKPAASSAHGETLMDRTLSAIAEISSNRPKTILVISAIVILFSIIGIFQIRFSHDPLRFLPKDNPARVATEKLDEVLRGSITMEVIIDTGKENGLYNEDLLNRLDETAAWLEKMQVGEIFAGKAWSITTILKETHRALNENRKDFYAIPQDRRLIAQELLLFENSGSDDMEDFTDSQLQKARLIVKVPFKDAIAYGRYQEVVNEHIQKHYPDVSVTVTGMTALFSRTLVNAIASMTKSYTYALVIITVLMILLIGRLRVGLLSMVPNLTPILLAIGLMGWLHIPMNLFNMLVGNIAIGLAVDDTIHFMHNFRRYWEKTGDAKTAVKETLNTTGRAMLVTSCVLSIGFFIFMFSSMENLFHFGLLTGFTITMALAADYFIAPALMVIVNR